MWRSVHWLCKFFKFIIEIDQSEMTASHLTNTGTSLNFTNYKCLTAKQPSRAQFFYLVIKIDQSETTKSHMFSTSLRLTDHK